MGIVASGGYGWGAPGPTGLVQSQEATIGWGGSFWGGYQWTDGTLSSTTTDVGNTPNTVLRPGLLLGQLAATPGQYTAYSANATDGSNVAVAILTCEVNMLDPFTNAVAGRYAGMFMCGGPVKASQLIGLDGQARAQMRARFMFDDDFPGRQFPWLQVIPQTTGASYACVAADSGKLFIANSTGQFTFTLPPIANGISIWFLNEANQNMVIASNEGANIVGDNSATYNDITFVTASHKIGGFVQVSSFYDGTNLKWVPQVLSAPTNTVTFS
jgi:hypothetical protein